MRPELEGLPVALSEQNSNVIRGRPDMRITRVECIPVTTPLIKPIVIATTNIDRIDQIVLKIHTDEGIVGFADSGDTSAFYHGEIQDSIAGIISTTIAPRILIGEDPMKIEKIVGLMDLLVRD